MSSLDQTKKYYDENADVYDAETGFDLSGGQEYNFREYYRPFLDSAIPSSGKALELGCGTGFYTKWLADRGLDVVAMDISSKMIEHARLRCPVSVRFATGNCEEPAAALDAESAGDGFDLIIGINTFSYYPNKKRALSNYREILRPAGRLVMLDMSGASFSQWIAYRINLRGARRFAENISANTPENLRSLLRETGFEVERMTSFTFMPNAMGRIGVSLWMPFEKALGRIPFARTFAIRIGWVARKL